MSSSSLQQQPTQQQWQQSAASSSRPSSSQKEANRNRLPPLVPGPVVSARAVDTSTPTVLESDPPPAILSSSQGRMPVSQAPPPQEPEPEVGETTGLLAGQAQTPPASNPASGGGEGTETAVAATESAPAQPPAVANGVYRNDAIYSMYTPAATIIDNIPPTVPRENAALIAQAAQARQAHYNRPPGTQTDNSSPHVVAVHYKVGNRLGEGSFGVIYRGTNLLTNQLVAIKFEPRKAEAPQLRDEYKTYKILQNCVGIPNAYYFGQEGLHNIMVMDLLGPSLEEMFDFCGRKFPVKTVCMLAKQMISRIQTMHDKGLIYRDIKPDNFLIGRIPSMNDLVTARVDRNEETSFVATHSPSNPHPSAQIFMVDFGMAKAYRDRNGNHIPYREKKSLSGTARYMSINTHLGREQSRRDDLEALGHVFIYFLRGSLPWQGLKAATNKQKYEKIGEKKQYTNVDELCEGFPEFAEYLKYARGLKFDETPDYDRLRGLMNKVLLREGEQDDGVYQWMYDIDREAGYLQEARIKSIGGPERLTQYQEMEMKRQKRYDDEARNSSIAANHQASMTASQTPLGASNGSQALAGSPSTAAGMYPMSPMGRDAPSPMSPSASGSAPPKNQRGAAVTGLPPPTDDSAINRITNARDEAARVRKEKEAAAFAKKSNRWYHRLFGSCFPSRKRTANSRTATN